MKLDGKGGTAPLNNRSRKRCPKVTVCVSCIWSKFYQFFKRKLIIKIHLLETANVLTWHFKSVDLELADRQVLSLIDVDSDESAHYGLVAWDGASCPGTCTHCKNPDGSKSSGSSGLNRFPTPTVKSASRSTVTSKRTIVVFQEQCSRSEMSLFSQR